MRRTDALVALLLLTANACSRPASQDGPTKPEPEQPRTFAVAGEAGEEPLQPEKTAESFSATFIVSGGRRISLNYLDDNNFELVPINGGAATIVVSSKIYVSNSQKGSNSETFLIGKIRAANEIDAPLSATDLIGQPTSIPAAGIRAWGLDVEEVHDVSVEGAGPSGETSLFTLTQNSRLGRAQWNIVNRLVPAMAMELCSNDVRQLTSWWPAKLIGFERAVLAAGSGVRLDGRIRSLESPVQLPAGLVIETAGSTLQRRTAKTREFRNAGL